METVSVDAPQIQLARINLTEWINYSAGETADELGVTWRGSPCAPSSLLEVIEEFRAGTLTGLPVRIFNRFCDNTIYVTPEDNVAYRFVHDSRHVFLQAGFDTEAELLVASCHLARLAHCGYGPETIEYRLLYADTVGQVLFTAKHRSFVANQLRFALRCLDRDVHQAIAEEAAAQSLVAS